MNALSAEGLNAHAKCIGTLKQHSQLFTIEDAEKGQQNRMGRMRSASVPAEDKCRTAKKWSIARSGKSAVRFLGMIEQVTIASSPLLVF